MIYQLCIHSQLDQIGKTSNIEILCIVKKKPKKSAAQIISIIKSLNF